MTHARRQYATTPPEQAPAQVTDFETLNAALVDPAATPAAVAVAIADADRLVACVLALAGAGRLGVGPGRAVDAKDLPSAIARVGRPAVQGLLIATTFGLLVPEEATVAVGTGARQLGFGRVGPCLGAPMEQEPSRHAIEVAVAAALIAPMVAASPLDAFTAGLLHDVGEQLIARAKPSVYPEIRRGFSSHDEQIRLEKEAFGTDHALVGAEYLLDWRVPDDVVDAVADHPDPFRESPPLTLVVAAADELLEGLVTRRAALDLLEIDPVEAHGLRRRIVEETARFGF